MRSITFGVLCKSQIHGKFALCLYKTMDELKQYDVDLQMLIGFSNLPVARSKVLTEWYRTHESGDIFFFLDADQTFRTEDIEAILNLKSDVKCALYPNAKGECIGDPVDRVAFAKGENPEITNAGCGLMAITWEIVDKLAKNLPIVYIHHDESLYPFFHGIFVEKENKTMWLGEDMSFCYQVRKVGGVLHGFVSPTIGHEVYKVETL
jgi:hypothetical protein